MDTTRVTFEALCDVCRVAVPEGVCGEYRVRRYEQDGHVYTALLRGNTLVMSDDPREVAAHAAMYYRARGRVLVNGLGLGMIVKACLSKPDVRHVDVIEHSEEVIKLVGPSYRTPRVFIHHADALTVQWCDGVHWDAVWHDIWDHTFGNYDAELRQLTAMYSGRCNWQGAWTDRE